MQITGFDASVTAEELAKVVAEKGGCLEGDVKVGSFPLWVVCHMNQVSPGSGQQDRQGGKHLSGAGDCARATA